MEKFESLSLFLKKLADYLGEKPGHNELVESTGWLETLANTCSLEDRSEAYKIKEFLEEIEPTIRANSETEYFEVKMSDIKRSLEIILEEESLHADDLSKNRPVGSLATNLKRIGRCLDLRMVGNTNPC